MQWDRLGECPNFDDVYAYVVVVFLKMGGDLGSVKRLERFVLLLFYW